MRWIARRTSADRLDGRQHRWWTYYVLLRNAESSDSAMKCKIAPQLRRWADRAVAASAVFLERADGKIAQPQIGVAALFPNPEQRPVQRLAQQVVAFAHGYADAFAEKTALDERPAAEGAAIAGIGAVDPECQRNRIAEDE